MHENKKPFYIPIATARNKLVLRDMVAGVTVLIDVMNSEYPYNRSITRCWRESHEDPTRQDIIWFENGADGERVKYGTVDDVLSLMEKSTTVL